jgi:hypothetical protein
MWTGSVKCGCYDWPGSRCPFIEYDTAEAYTADQRRVENDPEMIAWLDEWRNLLAGPVEVRTFRDVTPRVTTPEAVPKE